MASNTTFKPKNATPAATDYDFQLKGIQQQINDASNQIDNWPVGSPQFVAASKKIQALKVQASDLQAKIDAQKAETTKQTATKTETDLADATARAKAKGLDPASDPKVKAAKDAADAAAAKAGPKPFTQPMTIAGQTSNVAAKPTTTSTTSTGTKGGKTTTPPTATNPALTTQELLDKYGVQSALINSDPSLKALFAQATDPKNNWTKDQFTAEFLNTAWAKSHSESWQAATRAQIEAPGTYAQSYNNMRNYLARLAVSMGETINPTQLGKELTVDANGNYTTPVVQDPNDLVQWALSQSWGKGVDEAALKQHIAQTGKINMALPGGEAANYSMQLKSLANDYGLNNLNLTGGANYFTDAAQSILLGKSDINTWKQNIISQAKDNYKQYSPLLDAGISLRSIAAPYINSVANLMEVSPDTVDLSSTSGYGKMVADALRGTDPSNPQAISLAEFERQVKSNPNWGFTNNARDSVMGGVGGLLKMLGKVS
jgi:hypothetical protein